TSVTSTGAMVNGSAIPNLAAATGWFRYDTANPGACSDNFGARVPASGGASLGAGSTSAAYSQMLTALTPGTTYYYCAIGSRSAADRTPSPSRSRSPASRPRPRTTTAPSPRTRWAPASARYSRC